MSDFIVGNRSGFISLRSNPVSGYQQQFACYRPSTGEKLLGYDSSQEYDVASRIIMAAALFSHDEITCVSTTIQLPPSGWTGEVFAAVEVTNASGGTLRAEDVDLRIDGASVPPIFGRSLQLDVHNPEFSMSSKGMVLFGSEPVEIQVQRVDGYTISMGCQVSENGVYFVDESEIEVVSSDPAVLMFTASTDNTCIVSFVDTAPEVEPDPEPEPDVPDPIVEVEKPPVEEEEPAEQPTDVAYCNGLEVTVYLANGDVPTDGDDVIRGTSGPDSINALGGNDTICALQGNDVINAGDGFDMVFAGGGDDVVLGGAGNDKLMGGLGDDALIAGPGNDRAQGGAGNDTLLGESGSDRLAGGDGNDLLNGGASDDYLFGNQGRDALSGDAGDDVLRGGGWLDTMNGGSGDDGCTLTDPSGLTESRMACEAGVYGR